jgi:hypothetical protein
LACLFDPQGSPAPPRRRSTSYKSIREANPGAPEKELQEKCSAAIAENPELKSAIAREVFENFLAANGDLDLSDFDMSSEILPMMRDWCEEQTDKVKAERGKKERRR